MVVMVSTLCLILVGLMAFASWSTHKRLQKEIMVNELNELIIERTEGSLKEYLEANELLVKKCERLKAEVDGRDFRISQLQKILIEKATCSAQNIIITFEGEEKEKNDAC